MRLILVILYILQFNVILSCKKKENIAELPKVGEFYIYKNDIPIYENPDRGKVIDKINFGEKVEIVKAKVPDKVKGFWYKAVHGDNIGYIPLMEETNKNLVAFIYKNEKGRILASSLRIRETPNLKGKVLGAVPKGTIVDILSQGLVYEKIDDKYDTWMKIKTSEGITGYSYAGYITRDLNADLDVPNAEHIIGFVEIKDNPHYLVLPAGREVLGSDPAPCGENFVRLLPNSGDIHKTFFKYSVDGITYYKIEMSYPYQCYESYRAWISEKEVVFVEDIYKYTLEKNGSKFNKNFLDVINENTKGELNVKTLEIEPFNFKIKERGYTFYKVNDYKLFYRFQDTYHYAGNISGEIVDINRDGTDEIISDGFCGCLCDEASVTVWNGTKLETIFSELPQGSGSLKWEIGNQFIIMKRDFYSYDKQTNLYSETYYELKDNKLLPLKKKPQG